MGILSNYLGARVWNMLANLGADERERLGIIVDINSEGDEVHIRSQLGSVRLVAEECVFRKQVSCTNDLTRVSERFRGAMMRFHDAYYAKRPTQRELSILENMHDELSVFLPGSLQRLEEDAELAPVPGHTIMWLTDTTGKEGFVILADMLLYFPPFHICAMREAANV